MSKPKIQLPTEACLLKDRQRFVKSSKQALFDRAVRGVLKQGKRCAIGGNCKYRLEGGLKCAFGHLLSDETVELVGNGAGSYTVTDRMGIGGPSNPKRILVAELQWAHDSCRSDASFINDFRRKVAEIADRHKLNAKVCGDVPGMGDNHVL
jgi:hypothetical protein